VIQIILSTAGLIMSVIGLIMSVHTRHQLAGSMMDKIKMLKATRPLRSGLQSRTVAHLDHPRIKSDVPHPRRPRDEEGTP
jgi:hypothetical protein